MNNRIMFLRDKFKHPIGCIAINVDRKNHKLNFQYSVRNPHDQFDRKIARHLALGRLVETPVSLPLSRTKDISMHDISLAVMNHLSASSAPNRAVRAARLWLKTNANKVKAQKDVKVPVSDFSDIGVLF